MTLTLPDKDNGQKHFSDSYGRHSIARDRVFDVMDLWGRIGEESPFDPIMFDEGYVGKHSIELFATDYINDVAKKPRVITGWFKERERYATGTF